MRFKITHIIISAIFILSVCNIAQAQQDSTKLKQEVEVVKAYQPNVSDAFKINDIPQIKEEKPEQPVFEYSIYSEPVFSTFSVKPVQAATVVGTPKPELQNGLLKLGIGSYTTPYGELFYNALPGKKSDFSMHFKHLSSHGKVKLLNDDKVKAPFSENQAELFSTHYFRNSSLKLKGFFDRNAFRYYGYAGSLLTDAEKESLIPMWQEKQAFSKGGINFSLQSNPSARLPIRYDLGFDFHLFSAKTGQTEQFGKLKTTLDKDFNTMRGILDAAVSYYHADKIANRDVTSSTQRQQIMLMVNPAVVFAGDNTLLQLGANTYTLIDDDNTARVTLHPNVKAEWWPVPGVLSLYARANGYLDQNIYSKIAAENPYVRPDHDVRETEHQYILSGGIKGKFSSKTNFTTEVAYSGMKDMHFYYLTSTDMRISGSPDRLINNTFDVLYDDMKQLRLTGEIFHAASENLQFHLRGNYYSYTMDRLEKAWNLPEFDLSLSVVYKTDGPLTFSFDSHVTGKREMMLYDQTTLLTLVAVNPQTVFQADPVFDLNASVEYQFRNNLSFFMQLNNFAFQKSESWLGYANQGFNALAGISFSF